MLIVLAWAAVTLTAQGVSGGSGLAKSEGHRVVPAVEMLDTGNYLVPHMFGQSYLRKPPGGIWAFAGAIRLTGDHVLGPRLVSAGAFLLMALGSWWFARRWFGDFAGLAAGLATVFTPTLWYGARAAELESLNNLFAALAAWTVVELAMRRSCRPWLATSALGLFVGGLMLVKGPAGLPASAGMLIGVAWAARSWRPLAAWRVWLGTGLGAMVFAGVWLGIESAVAREGLSPVRQSPAAFLFEPGAWLDRAAFGPMVFLGAMPLALAALFPWGPDARAEANAAGQQALRRLHLARVLTLGALAGTVLMLLAGVDNPRYAEPVIATMGPLAGWAVAGIGASGVFSERRKRIGAWLTLGGPAVLAVVLLAGALVNALVIDAGTRDTSGEPAGRDAARALIEQLRRDAAHGPVVLLADGVIEARPEILLAFREEARRLGVETQVLWVPRLTQIAQTTKTLPHDAGWAVLRNDRRGNESRPFGEWSMLHGASVHIYEVEWRRRERGGD